MQSSAIYGLSGRRGPPKITNGGLGWKLKVYFFHQRTFKYGTIITTKWATSKYFKITHLFSEE